MKESFKNNSIIYI